VNHAWTAMRAKPLVSARESAAGRWRRQRLGLGLLFSLLLLVVLVRSAPRLFRGLNARAVSDNARTQASGASGVESVADSRGAAPSVQLLEAKP